MNTRDLLINLGVCCASVLVHGAAYAQGRVLTPTQLEAIVRTDFERCAPQSGRLRSGQIDPAFIIPSRNAREVPRDRITRTLHGMWRGRVLGDSNHVGVDYFWIMDTNRGEGLIIAQRTGRESMAGLQPVPNAPKLTYLMCAHEGYIPSKDSPQIHEFVKVSNTVDDAPQVMERATGMRFATARPTLSDMWRQMVERGYFNTPRGVAYAGGFFKPVQIGAVPSAIGPSQVSLRWDGEYRGGGATSLQFRAGVPIVGVEHAQFVGTSASAGDFLVASPGNGKLWKVEAFRGASYDLAFDSVVLGPLQ